jgi:hypothetical protein
MRCHRDFTTAKPGSIRKPWMRANRNAVVHCKANRRLHRKFIASMSTTRNIG